jgi:hypothetical protein
VLIIINVLYCIVYVRFVGVVHYYRAKGFGNRVIREVSRLKEKELTGQGTLATHGLSVLADSDHMKGNKRGGTRDTDD